MTSRRLAIVLVAGLLGAGCGNYSNEDLEFMAAVPTTNQLAVALPAAVNATTEAELAKSTHDAIKMVNDILASVLGLVDTVRSYAPTSRTTDSRTWGPFPDQKHPGWSWRLIVTRDSMTPTKFTFELDTENPATGWLQFLTGSFDAAGGARQGSGNFSADFALLRTDGFPLDASADNLKDLTISYQNFDMAGSPIEVTMTMNTVMPAKNGATSLNIVYEILADRSGEMRFTLTGDLVPGPAIETVQVNSQWLPSAAGEATLAVTAGDGAGLQQTECWDSGFGATYNSKPWSTIENTGTPADCPALPALPPLAP